MSLPPSAATASWSWPDDHLRHADGGHEGCASLPRACGDSPRLTATRTRRRCVASRVRGLSTPTGAVPRGWRPSTPPRAEILHPHAQHVPAREMGAPSSSPVSPVPTSAGSTRQPRSGRNERRICPYGTTLNRRLKSAVHDSTGQPSVTSRYRRLAAVKVVPGGHQPPLGGRLGAAPCGESACETGPGRASTRSSRPARRRGHLVCTRSCCVCPGGGRPSPVTRCRGRTLCLAFEG
ncbi:Uncharacterised protein [Actinomyces viscosus]|uniref:Uncharacterized protein n=1 Tax=Actinomyces viscosus TaxID=1656 RepID=A0A3S5EWL6_ACTVI|nr:Uncharacterised protein [Actinomyces viscosus]